MTMTEFDQNGQASVFVLALIGVVLVSAIFLFESGRLTSEKMQLQNAADAAAFGASTLEARALNFSAYTNRAMVANEVAIGQTVGILSLIDEIKTSGEYLDGLADVLFAISLLLEEVGVGEVLDAFAEVLEDVGTEIAETMEDVEETLKPVAEAAITALSVINTIYSSAQEVYYDGTLILEATTILQSLEDNVPGTPDMSFANLFDADKKGAHLSELGILALAGHIPSYIGIGPKWVNKFTRRYKTTAQSSEKKKEEEENKKEEDAELKPYKEKLEEDDKALADLNKKIADLTPKYKDAVVLYKRKKHDCDILQQLCHEDPKGNKSDCDKVSSCRKQEEKDKEEKDKYEAQLNKLKEESKTLKAKKEKDQEDLDEKRTEIEEEQKDGGDEDPNQGMHRLAATIREARDPFTSGSKKPIYDKGWLSDKQPYYNRNWFFGLGLDFITDVKILGIDFGRFGAKFSLGFDSKGGSEVRYKEDSYTWSAIDTSVFETEVAYYLFGAGFDAHIGVPTGGGGFQAPGKSSNPEDDEEEGEGVSNQLTLLDMPFTLGYSTDLDPQAYGYAGYTLDRALAWEGSALELTDEDNVLSDAYSGLKPYRDMDDTVKEESKFSIDWPWTAPFFLVGVIRKMDDINKTSSKYEPDEAPHFAGGMDLYDDSQDASGKTKNTIVDRVGAIAKSEVYFNRPTDLKYFLRIDLDDPKKLSNMKEEANVFSPFWQARLVKTSDTDRLIAMAIQHKKIWIAKRDADAIPGFEKVIKKLEDLLQIM